MAKGKRSQIQDDWQPDAAGREFAANNGVPDSEIGAFVDHHLAHGNTMASWPAAWRTWCRNAVRFGNANGRPAPPPLLLISGSKDDPYAAIAWAHTLRDGTPDKFGDETIVALRGYHVVMTAVDICDLAGLDPTSRPDLNPIADALREGCDADQMVEVVRGMRRPEKPTLRFYANAWREKCRKAA